MLMVHTNAQQAAPNVDGELLMWRGLSLKLINISFSHDDKEKLSRSCHRTNYTCQRPPKNNKDVKIRHIISRLYAFIYIYISHVRVGPFDHLWMTSRLSIWESDLNFLDKEALNWVEIKSRSNTENLTQTSPLSLVGLALMKCPIHDYVRCLPSTWCGSSEDNTLEPH